jgi:quercetin dioxygenase-like cupin family protein
MEGYRDLAKRIAETKLAGEVDLGWEEIFAYLRGKKPKHPRPGIRVLNVFADYFSALNSAKDDPSVPRVLFDNVLVPAVPRFVVVQEHDWIRPQPYASGEDGNKVEYELPCRALANSDISITALTIKKGGSCVKNHHLGWEFVLVTEGRVALHLDGEKEPILCGRREYLQYLSARPHFIENKADGDSKLLVIRFNELTDSAL